MKSKKSGFAFKIAFAVFLLFFVVTVFIQKMELESLNKEYDQLLDKYEKLEEYQNKLQNKLDSEFDDEYVQGVAKDKLNLVLPDEIIFYNDIAG